MKVVRTRHMEGAREARGITVIIDVFRAFTCTPLLLRFGAAPIYLEPDPDKAIAMKKAHSHWILMGEVDEVPLKGADLSNSPSAILEKGETFFRGRTVVHRTTAGVRGAVAAMEKADEVLLGAFVTAEAMSRYILKQHPDRVTLVAMGSRGADPAPEDEACGAYLDSLLTGKSYDSVSALRDILFQPTAHKFLYRERPYLPPEDPVLCLQRNLFDMVPGVERDKEDLVVVRKDEQSLSS